MADAAREVWITGVGIVSCLGEGADAHWHKLDNPPAPDMEAFAPYPLHRLGPIEFDKQIPKKGDQRQMESWQRIGTYAAGLALDDAGVKGNTEILSRMDMIVAAGGGERDEAVDTAILGGLREARDKGAFLNERLMSDLRPTLFLAQLSNLLAGNISIVHGVTGMSRTFMGGESAGVDAVRIALSRIEAGQSEIALVGGSFNAERKDLLLLFECGGFALKGGFAPVWDRAPLGGGLALGSMGAFLILESRTHAQARQARPLGRLAGVRSERVRRAPGAVAAGLARMWQTFANRIDPNRVGIICGASGAEPATAEERTWLSGLAGIPARASGTATGHGVEPQFAMNIALATAALAHDKMFAPCSASGVETTSERSVRQIVVTGVSHWRGEGMALVEAVR